MTDNFKAVLNCPELDGVGRWIYSIVLDLSRKWHENPEDLLQEAIVVYLKARPKYDPKKCKRTTFARVVVTRGLINATRKSFNNAKLMSRVEDVSTVSSVKDPERVELSEIEDIEQVGKVLRHARGMDSLKASDKGTWLRKQLSSRGWDNQRINRTISAAASISDPCRCVYFDRLEVANY